MTIIDGRFDADDKQEILDAFVASAENAFGQSLNPDEVSVIRAFYEPVAEYLASQQDDIRETLDAAQIDNASGDALDLLGALIGVPRNTATKAETRVEFKRGSRTNVDYTVPTGTVVQTDAVSPVKYETTEVSGINFIDGFEDNSISNYGGDTGSFTTQSGTTFDSTSYALEATASTGSIVDADDTYRVNSTFHARIYLNTNTIGGVLFGATDKDNTYRAVVDASADELRVEVVESGSVTDSTTSSATIPTGEWLDMTIDWNDGSIVLTLDDAGASEVTTAAFSESPTTYVNGGYGFYSGDANDSKFFDNFTMSTVGITAESSTVGSDVNVGANTLVIMPDAPNGVDSVTNPIGGTGGSDKEEDSAYRNRAKNELSEGTNATENALISALDRTDGTNSVSLIVNDSSSADGDGRPPHSFEAVVDAQSTFYGDIAETIVDTKAAGDISVGGYAGSSVSRSVELVNGESKTITFSTPTQVQIYIDVTLSKTSTYEGDAAVQDSLVQYIGGVLNDGSNVDGDIGVEDDVIYNKVVEAIMDVEGVFDITSLDVATSDPPSGSSNISIASTETAFSDATDGSLEVTSNDV